MKLIKKTILLLPLFSMLIIQSSCENDSEDDLVDTTPVTEISYINDIKTIIDSNCIACHNDPQQNGAPMALLTYANVIEAIENRGLISRISSQDPSFLMPAGGNRLPQATIDLVIQWQQEGLLEE